MRPGEPAVNSGSGSGRKDAVVRPAATPFQVYRRRGYRRRSSSVGVVRPEAATGPVEAHKQPWTSPVVKVEKTSPADGSHYSSNSSTVGDSDWRSEAGTVSELVASVGEHEEEWGLHPFDVRKTQVTSWAPRSVLVVELRNSPAGREPCLSRSSVRFFDR